MAEKVIKAKRWKLSAQFAAEYDPLSHTVRLFDTARHNGYHIMSLDKAETRKLFVGLKSLYKD